LLLLLTCVGPSVCLGPKKHSDLSIIKCTEIEIRPGDFPCCSAGKITQANFYLGTLYDNQVTVKSSRSGFYFAPFTFLTILV